MALGAEILCMVSLSSQVQTNILHLHYNYFIYRLLESFKVLQSTTKKTNKNFAVCTISMYYVYHETYLKKQYTTKDTIHKISARETWEKNRKWIEGNRWSESQFLAS